MNPNNFEEPPPPYTETNSHQPHLSPNTATNTSPSPQNRHSPSQAPRPQQQRQSQPNYPQQPPPPPGVKIYQIKVLPNTRTTEIPYPHELNCEINVHDWHQFLQDLLPQGSQRDDDAKRFTDERGRQIDRVIADWNRYFERKGLRVVLEGGPAGPPLPPSASSSSSSSSNIRDRTSFDHIIPPQQQQQQQRSRLSPRPSSSSLDRWTQKLKQVAADNDVTVAGSQIRVGQVFSLDPKALKIGKFHLSQKGMDYDGKPIVPQSVLSRAGFGGPSGGGYAQTPAQTPAQAQAQGQGHGMSGSSASMNSGSWSGAPPPARDGWSSGQYSSGGQQQQHYQGQSNSTRGPASGHTEQTTGTI